MTDIHEFLEARIDEDEAVARRALAVEQFYAADEQIYPAGEFEISYEWTRMIQHRKNGAHGHRFGPGCPSPTRVLRECSAKRAILALASEIACSGAEFADRDHATLSRALAAGYADHPDFDPAWR